MPTILVTGANGNLGNAVVEKLLAAGYRVEAAVGRSGSEMAPGANFHAESVDLMDESAAETYVKNVVDRSGRVSSALLLVGGFATGDFSSTDAASIQKMIGLNFSTAWNIARPLYQHLAENGGGQILLVGSRGPLEPSGATNTVAYALSKSLIFTLADLINASGAHARVRATVLVPSVIDTPQNRTAMPGADPSRMKFDSREDTFKAKAWKDVWGCGQGIGVLHDVPPVGELVQRFNDQYQAARAACALSSCKIPKRRASAERRHSRYSTTVSLATASASHLTP